MKALNQKKKSKKNMIMATSALTLCLGLSIAVNQLSFKGKRSDISKNEIALSGRGPASQIYEELRSGTLTIERKFAVKIARVSERGIASLGRPADLFENLKFGILEGKYALKMEGDKISEITFVDVPDSEGRPTAIKNRTEFLKEYGSLMDAQSEPRRVSVGIQGTKIIEIYRLKSSRGDTDTLVSFVVDSFDRVFDVRAEKVSALSIF